MIIANILLIIYLALVDLSSLFNVHGGPEKDRWCNDCTFAKL